MRAFVVAGSVVAAGLVSALLAQQVREEPANTTEQRQSDQPQGHMMHHQGMNMTAREMENEANLSPDQRTMNDMLRSNLFEVETARLVAGKVSQDNIKQFARMLADDHTKAAEQIRQIAKNKGLTTPQGLSEWQQAKLQHMSRLPAEDLARKFVFHEVGDHHTDILEARYTARNSKDQDLKTLATNMVPQLQKHLQEANRLAQQFVGEGTVTER